MSARRPNPTDSSANLDRGNFSPRPAQDCLAAAIPGGSHFAEAANLYPWRVPCLVHRKLRLAQKRKFPSAFLTLCTRI